MHGIYGCWVNKRHKDVVNINNPFHIRTVPWIKSIKRVGPFQWIY